MSDGKMVHVHLLDQANERALLLERELAQVKAERDEAEGLANRSKRRHEVCEAGRAEAWRVCGIWQADHVKAEAERDTALRHLQAVLSHGFAFERGHDFLQEAAARAFLLSMREKAGECLGCETHVHDGCGVTFGGCEIHQTTFADNVYALSIDHIFVHILTDIFC